MNGSKAQAASLALALIAVLLLAGFGYYAYGKISESKTRTGQAGDAGSLDAAPTPTGSGPVENMIEVLETANEYVFEKNSIAMKEKIRFGGGRYEDEVDFANAGDDEFGAVLVEVTPPLLERYYRYAGAQRGLAPENGETRKAGQAKAGELRFQDEAGERIVLSEEIAPNVYVTELRIAGGGILRTYAQAEVNAEKLDVKPIRLLTKPGLSGKQKTAFARLAAKLNALELNAKQSAALEKNLNDAFVEARNTGKTLDEWFAYADELAESIARNGFEQAMTAATMKQTAPAEPPLNAGDYKTASGGGIAVSGSTEFTVTEATPRDQRMLAVARDGQPAEFLYSFEGGNAAAFSAEKISSTSETLLLVKADYSRVKLSGAFFPFAQDSVTLKLWFPKTLEYESVELKVEVLHEKLRDPADPWRELAAAEARKTVYPQSFGEPDAWSKTSGLKGKRVFIDAGHGSAAAPNAKYGDSPDDYGYGAGAFVKGKRVWECDLNLAVALKLKEVLEANGAIVALSRSANIDGFLNLTARAVIANAWNADVVVSVHHDHSGATQPLEYYPEVLAGNGPAAYCSETCVESKKLAFAIDGEISKIKTAGESRGPTPDYKRGFRLGLLHKTYAPAVIVEVTGMGNANAFKPGFQSQAAQAIFSGIKNYFENRG